MKEADTPSEIEARWGAASLRARSKYIAELVASVSLFGLAGLAILFWRHQDDTLLHQRESRELNKQVIYAIRMQTCLIALPEQERKAEYAAPYGVCKTLANPSPGVW